MRTRARSTRTTTLTLAIASAFALAACGGSTTAEPAATEPVATSDPAAASAAEADASDQDTSVTDEAPPTTESAAVDAAEVEPAADETAAEEATDSNADADAADGEVARDPIADDPPPPPRDPGDGTTAAQAASFIDTPFSWSQEGATWSFEADGFLRTTARNPDDGGCLVLFGTATPTDLGEWPWSNPRVTPDIELVAGDELIRAQRGACDESAARETNHNDFLSPTVIVGSAYSFALHYRLNETPLANVEAVVWGGDDEDLVQQYFLPTIIDSPPEGTVPTTDYSAFASSPIEGATWQSTERDLFDFEFQGVVQVPAASLAEERGGGSCSVVLGSTTVAGVQRGFGTFGGHSIAILAGGRLLDNQQNLCETTALEQAGYQQIDQVNLTAGTSIDFFEAVFIPDEVADTEQLVVTDAFFNNESQFYSFTELDAVPAPLAKADAPVIPAAAGPMTGGPFVFQADEDDTTFTISLEGVVNGGQTDDGLHTCFFVLGTMSADQEENVNADVGLLTSGQLHSTSAFDCNARDLEDLGWESLGFIDFEPDVEAGFYVLVLVPTSDAAGEQFVVIGNPATDEPHIVLDPVYLDAVPAR